MRIHRIESLDLPELAPYRTLRQHEDHRRAGIFVAEGDKVVRRLLASDFSVVSMLLPEKWLPAFEPLIRKRPEDIPVYIVEISELEKLTGFPFYQGVLAVGGVPCTHTVASALAAAPEPRLFVAIDALANSENIGTVVRSAAAFGAHAMIVDGTSASPYLRRAVRNSMGAIFKLPIVETESLVSALDDLRKAGCLIVAAHPRTPEQVLQKVDFKGNCCIVLGSEGTGLSPTVLAACDTAAAIPMHNEVDSLNVSSAAAVFLYEIARQRSLAIA